MNRRTEARQPIALLALVHPKQGKAWMCTIRDFCRGGMLLSSDPGQPTLAHAGAMLRKDDMVTVHFSVPTGAVQRHFRINAQIARVLDGSAGIGVYVADGVERQALAALTRFAGVPEPEAGEGPAISGDARDPRITEEHVAKVRTQLRHMLERAVPRVARAFLERADKDLLVRARDAGTTSLQNALFQSMTTLEKNRREVEEQFQGVVLRQVDAVEDAASVIERRRRKSFAGQAQKLALVDTARFEDWLAIAEVISKAEARSQQALTDIRLRMALMARAWGHKDVNPVSPSVLISCLDDTLDTLDLHKSTRNVLYKSMQESILPLLRSLYASIDEWLATCGFFPPLDELEEKPAPKPKPTQEKNAGGQDAAAGATGGHSAGASASPQSVAGGNATGAGQGFVPGGFGPGGFGPGGLVGVQGGNHPGLVAGQAPGISGGGGADQALANGAAGQTGIQVPRLQGQPGVAGGGTGAWGNSAYQAVRQLLDLGRRASAARGAGAPLEAPIGEGDEFNTLEIVAGLSDLQRRGVVASSPLRTQLVDQLRRRSGEPERGLSAGDIDRFQVVENLVASIQQDDLVTDGVKQWVKRLEVTLSKLAAQQPEFLNSTSHNPHAAIEVLNQLAKLGNTADEGEGIDREVGRRVDDLMNKLIHDFDSEPEVFDDVLKKLHPLVERQTRAYRGNFERTVRQSEGQQKLTSARRAVLEVLERRVADREVPELMLQLLTPGWRNLMVHAYLRHGPSSREWRDNVDIVDRIGDALSGTRPASATDARQLVEAVRLGLESISFDPLKRDPLLQRLTEALSGNPATPEPRKHVARADAARVLELEGVMPEQDPEPVAEDADTAAHWQRSLAQARKLQVGDWLAYTEQSGRPRILTLAFVGESHSSFVLVNRKGIKVKEFSLREMTEAISHGVVATLDEFDLPLTERATHRMLQNMHNQIAYLAAHDELTGLINRREFEKKLEKLIATARTSDYHHVLLYIDIDQFKVINNTSGHAAGDDLLKLLAGKLKHSLRGTRHTLARLGGDEFGILLDRTSDDEGRRIAENQLDTIRQQRFEVEGRMFTTAASIGMVSIDGVTQSVTSVLQLADAACFAAKDAGRNRVHLYEGTDVKMQARRGAMEWAVQIDKATAENRLILNCQRIQPITADFTEQDVHYELLLTMVDEQGNTVAPADFIAAAETYNRMAQVDRWVVRNALLWMSEHRAAIERVGGFSINVSGHSINDESFTDFVLRQFSLTRVPTGKVCFEVTETAAISNLSSAVAFMNKMKLIGCKFSLDDFGTGLSSYSYLRNLPVDFIKIDGVFVQDLPNNPADYAVVKSINEIAHFMGKRTVAEYVESAEILAQLKEIGVDFAQGYGIERPRPLAEFEQTVASAS